MTEYESLYQHPRWKKSALMVLQGTIALIAMTYFWSWCLFANDLGWATLPTILVAAITYFIWLAWMAVAKDENTAAKKDMGEKRV